MSCVRKSIIFLLLLLLLLPHPPPIDEPDKQPPTENITRKGKGGRLRLHARWTTYTRLARLALLCPVSHPLQQASTPRGRRRQVQGAVYQHHRRLATTRMMSGTSDPTGSRPLAAAAAATAAAAAGLPCPSKARDRSSFGRLSNALDLVSLSAVFRSKGRQRDREKKKLGPSPNKNQEAT